MKPEMMKQLIACCGLDCENCDARIATVRDDNELRENRPKVEHNEQCTGNYTGNHKLYGVSHGRSEICVLQ